MTTKTTSFGTGRREGHDASAYYERALQTVRENRDRKASDEEVLSQVHAHSSEAMTELPDDSVALMVTSPPYLYVQTACLRSTMSHK